MKRRFRLRSTTDFERVRRSGKSFPHPLVVLVAAPNDLDQVRVGVAAGRSVGGAVAREPAKRVLRACVEHWLADLRPGWDLI
nr:ribonuclease P protein component [Anaerolinea sp.]